MLTDQIIQSIIFPNGLWVPRKWWGAKRTMYWDISAWQIVGRNCCIFVLHSFIVIRAVWCDGKLANWISRLFWRAIGEYVYSKKRGRGLRNWSKYHWKYRRDNQIPDSDGFAMITKRGRSETMSTNLSDEHHTNRPKYAGIPEAVLA